MRRTRSLVPCASSAQRVSPSTTRVTVAWTAWAANADGSSNWKASANEANPAMSAPNFTESFSCSGKGLE